MKRETLVKRAIVAMVMLAMIMTAIPLTVLASERGPYGAEDFTYEDYLREARRYRQIPEPLSREDWNRIVELSHREQIQFVSVDLLGNMYIAYLQRYEDLVKIMMQEDKDIQDAIQRELDAQRLRISGKFYLDGDPGKRNWYELGDDFTIIHYFGENWSGYTYRIEENILSVIRYSIWAGDVLEYTITILDENRLQTETRGIGIRTYVRMEGVVDNLNRRRHDEDFWDFWNRIPYSEQMRIYNEEAEVYQQMERDAAARGAERAAAEAAARAAIPITLKVNGRVISTDSPPVVENGRTLVPVRAFVEALGYIVSWDSGRQVLDIYDPETHALRISLTVGSNRARVSTGIYGVTDERILDVPAKIINGRTMVPVRFIAETLGCTVSWDEATKTISIVHNAG